MKIYLAIIFLTYTATISLAQETETRNPGSFTGVKASEGVDVYLKKGDRESVKIEVTNGSTKDVLTEVSGSYLKVHMRNTDDRRASNMNVKVYVTYVKIDRLSASAAGTIYGEGSIKGTSMDISASSAGSVEVSVDAESLTVSSSSAADVELKGKCESITLDASTAGQIDAYDLESGKVKASASTAGSIKISVQNDLTAHASTGGTIRYRGNPDKSITESSTGGSVKKSN
jgi:hypothetical protein